MKNNMTKEERQKQDLIYSLYDQRDDLMEDYEKIERKVMLERHTQYQNNREVALAEERIMILTAQMQELMNKILDVADKIKEME